MSSKHIVGLSQQHDYFFAALSIRPRHSLPACPPTTPVLLELKPCTPAQAWPWAILSNIPSQSRLPTSSRLGVVSWILDHRDACMRSLERWSRPK